MQMHPFAVLHLLPLVAAAAAAAVTSQSQAPPAAAGLHASGAACIARERDALLAFKRGITGDPAGRIASWHQGDQNCCRWRGIRCSNQTGHVLGIHLRRNVDEQMDMALAGQISPSLVSLHHLEYLDLSYNDLSGPAGVLPEFLGLLNNLTYLNLSHMSFAGRVPPHLGNLSKLNHLDLSYNVFTGPVPSEIGMLNNLVYLNLDVSGTYLSNMQLYSTDLSWLSNLPLRYLNMGSVNLSAIADWARVANMIPSLEVLCLPYCSLTSAEQFLPHLNLTHLEDLILSGNSFDHPIASCWFWNLTSLRYLELNDNSLYGQMPDALGGMTSLQVIDFSSIGSIDMTTANMTNLCSLETINLYLSQLNGSITELFERLPQCPSNKLTELHFGLNNFNGVLPDRIGRWPNLHILDLTKNKITGQLPSEIGMLRSLVTLDLSFNGFTGQLPSEIGMLRSLVILDLSYNGFTGPVPSEIGMLNSLTDMYLDYNNLSGVITHEHLDGLSRLTRIGLSRNSLKIEVDTDWLPPFRLVHASLKSCHMGPLFPSWLQSQTGIQILYISSATISDTIPDWFSTTFSNAEELDFSDNNINGTLPRNLKNMTSLGRLFLGSNQLTGQIPQLPPNLAVLDISMNYLSGPLPANFGAPILHSLNLFSNHITGHIPQSICQVTSLNLAYNHLEGEFPQCVDESSDVDKTALILSNNMISGKLEPILKAYTNLSVLDLAWNNFTGSIPAMITDIEELCYLNLAGNSLSGALPRNWSNLVRMQSVVDAEPGFVVVEEENVSLAMKGQERFYSDYRIYDIVSIDLSSNYLTGGIPEEITTLLGASNLNLSRNNLTGKISERIGVMKALESLDLSENKLYGEIPRSLSNLTFLSFMDLSHNNLTGTIPSGGQLDTLYTQNPFMYDGNSGLCGYPLKKNCTTNNRDPKHGDQKRDEQHDDEVLTFSFVLGIGYVVGLWMVFCVILFNKTWRIAYFRLSDKVFDKVYVSVVVTWARWAKK